MCPKVLWFRQQWLLQSSEKLGLFQISKTEHAQPRACVGRIIAHPYDHGKPHAIDVPEMQALQIAYHER